MCDCLKTLGIQIVVLHEIMANISLIDCQICKIFHFYATIFLSLYFE